jgi:hypothetical protein
MQRQLYFCQCAVITWEYNGDSRKPVYSRLIPETTQRSLMKFGVRIYTVWDLCILEPYLKPCCTHWVYEYEEGMKWMGFGTTVIPDGKLLYRQWHLGPDATALMGLRYSCRRLTHNCNARLFLCVINPPVTLGINFLLPRTDGFLNL